MTLNEKFYIIKKKWISKSKIYSCMNASHTMSDDIKYFQQVEPERYFERYKLATENLHLASIFLQLVAKRRPNDFFNFES